MINVKKWGKRVGLVFLALGLVVLAITFMPIVDLMTFYLVQLAGLAIQVAIALATIKLAIVLILWVMNKKKFKVPAIVTKLSTKYLKKVS